MTDRVLEENEAFLALGLGTWRGRKWTQLLAAGDRIYHETNVRPIIGVSRHLSQIAATLRSGTRRVEGFVAYRVLEDGRTLVAFTAADERRRYEDQLRAARDQARAAAERLTCLARMSAELVRAVSTEEVQHALGAHGSTVLGVGALRCWLVDDHELRAGADRIDRREDHPAWDTVLDGKVHVDGDLQMVPVAVDGRVIAALELRPPLGADPVSGLLDSVVDQVGAAILRIRSTELTIAHATQLSLTDPLTQLPNRRHVERELGLRYEHQQPYAAAIVDVDHFKQCNDRYGHDVGDAVLVAVAARLRASLRSRDVVGRWGGEEFLLVLDVADREVARSLCERLCQEVRDHPIAADAQLLQVTVSVGFTVARPGESPLEVVRRADTALYNAKNAGRNCVCEAEV